MLESLTTEAEKTIRFLQTRRRKRHARAKEISKSIQGDLDGPSTSVSATDSLACPVCGIVPRDEVMDEHIDRCLAETAASEAFRAEVADAERQFQQPIGDTYIFGGEARIRVTSLTGFAGGRMHGPRTFQGIHLYFYSRNRIQHPRSNVR